MREILKKIKNITDKIAEDHISAYAKTVGILYHVVFGADFVTLDDIGEIHANHTGRYYGGGL